MRMPESVEERAASTRFDGKHIRATPTFAEWDHNGWVQQKQEEFGLLYKAWLEFEVGWGGTVSKEAVIKTARAMKSLAATLANEPKRIDQPIEGEVREVQGDLSILSGWAEIVPAKRGRNNAAMLQESIRKAEAKRYREARADSNG